MSDFAEPGSGAGEVCAGCGARIWQDGLSCGNCGALRFDRSGALELAPRLRRLAAYLIDTIGIGIVALAVFLLVSERTEDDEGRVVVALSRSDELVIGAVVLGAAVLAWLWSASRGQSPGMRLLGLFVYRTGGGAASPTRVIVRDLWPNGINLLFALIALLVGDSVDDVTTTAATAVGVIYVISAACVLWLRDRRALHDLAFDTVVVQQRRVVLGVPIDETGAPPRHGRPSPPGELPPDR